MIILDFITADHVVSAYNLKESWGIAMEDTGHSQTASATRENAAALIGLSFLWLIFRGNFFGELVMYGMADHRAETFYYALFLLGASFVPLLLLNTKTLALIRRLGARRWFPIALALLTVSGCTTIAHCSQGRLLFPYLLPFGGVCAALGLFGTIPLWAEYLVGRSRRSILGLLLFSMALSCTISLAAALVPQSNPGWVVALTALVPGFAYAFLPHGRVKHELGHGEASEDFALVAGQPLPTIAAMTLFLVVGAVAKGCEFQQGSLGFDATFTAVAMLFILMFVVIVAAILHRFGSTRLMVNFLWLALVGVYLAGFLLLLTSFNIPFVDCFIVAARYALFFFLILLLVFYIRVDSSRRRAAYVIFIAAQILSALITYCAVPLLIDEAGFKAQDIELVALVLLLVPIAFVMVMVLKSQATANRQPAGAALLSGELLDTACGLLSAECGLTPRESEVLALLYKTSGEQDDAMKAIAERLFISVDTVRSHKKRIYRKMDVHSRRELATRVEKAARGAGKPQL